MENNNTVASTATTEDSAYSSTKLAPNPPPPSSSSSSSLSAGLVHSDGTPIQVIDVDNRPVNIIDIWQSRRSIIVFVRHFLCIDCQDYFRLVWSQFLKTDYVVKQIQFIIIGCGSPKLGKSLAEDLGAFNHPYFNIYTDPQREAYTALGLIYKMQFSWYRCFHGAIRTCWQGTTKCWCIWNSGDTKQNGGVFVLEKGTGMPLYQHIDQEPDDHADVQTIFTAAGLNTIT